MMVVVGCDRVGRRWWVGGGGSAVGVAQGQQCGI